jgi:hypothetical protein
MYVCMYVYMVYTSNLYITCSYHTHTHTQVSARGLGLGQLAQPKAYTYTLHANRMLKPIP